MEFSFLYIYKNTDSCERPSLIGLAQKGKYRVNFLVCIKNIICRHLEYCKYLSTYSDSMGIKYIVNRH